MREFFLVIIFAGRVVWQQRAEGIVHTGITDNCGGENMLAIRHFNPYSSTIFNDDLFNIGVGKYVTATLLNNGNYIFRHFRRATNRIITTV